MNRLLYLLVLTFIYANLNAQSVDFETTLRTHFFSRPMEILPYNSDNTLVVSANGGCDYPYANESLRLEDVNNSGNPIGYVNYTNPILADYCIENVNAVLGTDNSIYVHIYGFDCDFGLSLLIVKFDDSGNPLWTKTDDELPIDYSGEESIKLAQNNGLWVLTSQYGIVRLDADGDIVQTIPHPQGSGGITAFDYELSTNELVYFQRVGNTYELVYVGADGSVQTIPWSESIEDVYLMGDYILLRKHSKLSLFDKEGNVLQTMVSFSFDDILEVSDQYIYTYKSSNNTLMKIDTDFNINNQLEWSFGDIKDLSESEGYLTTLGKELDHIYVKTIDTDLSYNSENTDIGLVDILLDTTYITSSGDCPSYPNSANIYRYHTTGLEVVIKNFGAVPISYCEINARYYTSCEWFWCGIYSTHYRGYTFPPIMPGNTYTLSLPDLYIDSLSSNAVLELYTSSPNHKIDKDQTNNEFRRDFLTSIASVQNQLPFVISPTLATNIINIESNEIADWQKANIKIITIDGRQIDVEAPQVDVSALPAGVYILHCEYDGLSGSRRFVKY